MRFVPRGKLLATRLLIAASEVTAEKYSPSVSLSSTKICTFTLKRVKMSRGLREGERHIFSFDEREKELHVPLGSFAAASPALARDLEKRRTENKWNCIHGASEGLLRKMNHKWSGRLTRTCNRSKESPDSIASPDRLTMEFLFGRVVLFLFLHTA